jgi:hypothetical protein
MNNNLRMTWRQKILTAAIVLVLLFFFQLPISMIIYGGGIPTGLLLLVPFCVLQFPLMYLVLRRSRKWNIDEP